MSVLRQRRRGRIRRPKRRSRPGLWRLCLSILRGGIVAFVLVTVSVVISLRWVNPPTSSFIIQRSIQSYREGDASPGVIHHWTSWSDIPTNVCLAVVASEDQRFPFHHGFDFDALREAIDERVRGGRLRGASTISQQLAKNLFLWRGRSLLRKGLEAYFTVIIEGLWPKRRILEIYLNSVQFGDRIFGVGAAVERYFGKPVSKVSVNEAALLAAVLPNPVRFRVDAPSTYVRERAAWIRGQMQALGMQHLVGIC